MIEGPQRDRRTVPRQRHHRNASRTIRRVFATNKDLRARVGTARRWIAGLVCVVASVASGCDNGGTRRPREGVTITSSDASSSNNLEIPRESNAAVITQDAGDFLGTQCPGTRLWRVTRSWEDGGELGLGPRYYGRNDQNQVLSLKEVLLCELREMHWVTTPHDEGTNLLLWRGPWLFAPDQDCHWRPPFRTQVTPSGRALIAREHCAHGASSNGSAGGEHTVTIEVTSDYRDIRR